MAAVIESLTDDEILAVADDPAMLAKFTPEEKARLRDLRGDEPTQKAGPKPEMLDRLIDLLPAAGGTVGGIAGGIGGTAFGVGIGGVPGAVGGATLGGAAGESAKQLINRARGKQSPASSLDALVDITKQAGIQGGAEVVGGAVTKGATSGARAVYRGYLKPSLSERLLPKANEIVETAIREALPIARSGAQKADRLIKELRGEVSNILKASSEKIDLHGVAERVRAFAKQRYFKPGADQADYKAALEVADSLDQHASLGLPPGARPTKVNVSLSGADDAKRTLDSSIGDASFGVTRGATKTTQKMARRDLRAGLEQKAPTIAPLNARESKLIDAARSIRRAVEREANQNPVYGVKTLVSAGAAGGSYARGDDPATALAKGAMMRGALTPKMQSLLAIGVDRIAKELGVSTAVATRLAVHVFSEPEQRP